MRAIFALILFVVLGFWSDLASAQMLTGADARRNVPVNESAVVNTSYDENSPVDLTADSLSHDDDGQIVTARGNVIIKQSGRTLKADEVVYNLQQDTVKARGNVWLREPTGDLHFADEVLLNNKMREGFASGLQSYLADGGRFSADSGDKTGSNIVMTNAAYTPCECDDAADGDPVWQIKADQVTYHQDENRISYNNATFEMFGVPLLWTPYLSHPDGQIKQKSGLLTPKVGYDSEIGFNVAQSYYWALAPDKDLTTGLLLTTEELPVALAEYRQRFGNAELEVSGSATYSDWVENVGDQHIQKDEELRGHVFAEGRWDINDKWRGGIGLEMASDDQYLKQYDFSGKDILENEIYVERFSGRDYATGRLLAFQDTRVSDDLLDIDQPNVLPEVDVQFLGDAAQTFGGRWSVDLSLLGIQRESGGQDVGRSITEIGWQRRDVLSFGLVNTIDLSARADAYYVDNRFVAANDPDRSNNGSEFRTHAKLHMTSSYPMARSFDNMQAVIEPVVALTLSPNVNSDSSNIPNEDSRDVQIDTSNLFEAGRFPGYDRIEDSNHVTYGLRTGLYGHEGSYGNIFIGQSRRFNDDDNPFPQGSGFDEQESDIVGQISGVYDGNMGVNYRFQLDSQSLSSQRHELDSYASYGPAGINGSYLFAKALEGTTISESREQVQGSTFYDVTDQWRVSTGALYDLGIDQGLRKALFGVDFTGCCLLFSARAQRSLTSEISGDSGTSVTFRLGLKGIGEFQTSDTGGFGLGN